MRSERKELISKIKSLYFGNDAPLRKIYAKPVEVKRVRAARVRKGRRCACGKWFVSIKGWLTECRACRKRSKFDTGLYAHGRVKSYRRCKICGDETRTRDYKTAVCRTCFGVIKALMIGNELIDVTRDHVEVLLDTYVGWIRGEVGGVVKAVEPEAAALWNEGGAGRDEQKAGIKGKVTQRLVVDGLNVRLVDE